MRPKKADNKRPVIEMAGSSAYDTKKADIKKPVAKKIRSRVHETERANNKNPITEMVSSRRFYCLNKGLCKYNYRYISPALIDLRENLYKWQVW